MVQSVVPPAQIDLAIEAIREICRRYPIRELAVFGSVLRDDFAPDSDIDLLVEFEPDARIGFIGFGELEQELEAVIGRRIDLVSKRALRKVFRDAILSSAWELYAAA